MRISIDEARQLVVRVMVANAHSSEYAGIIADHIIDCELRGLEYGGLARVISIVERLQRTGAPKAAVEVAHQTPVSARLRGNDNLGYVVAYKATEIAIEKAKAIGLAMVGADQTWYTGMLSVFAEMAAAEGLVTMIASNATPWVAPHGAVEGRFGTNPICFGFPSTGDPIIWDIGTSSIMHAEAVLARRHGHELAPGHAFDAEGNPTRDPDAALAGAFTPWGGHKGSGLGHVVQLLGVLAGSPIQPPELADFGFVIITMKPDLMMPEQDYRAQVTAYAETVRAARPIEGGEAVRMPFDRSAAERRRRLSAGEIEVPDFVYERLREMAS
ncbi:MAG: Ldh family oxidoreductase [Rhodospirillaceae bacterium]|jgi:delta1-piperideine-2-carboxylate reductase|nr:Ldh family oxidoreductase [Rhodospirillaceae bacterium]MBT5897668.1 Ldh family oxidoreductase [Rhodospirillaceae bacterium]MBT6430016.1 Ldh family oxidoreductase [Rhodospirillaceae bacterium]MBT7756964.1 Ldh family oxidoreductase [Rhodospirillaceae bacterium]